MAGGLTCVICFAYVLPKRWRLNLVQRNEFLGIPTSAPVLGKVLARMTRAKSLNSHDLFCWPPIPASGTAPNLVGAKGLGLRLAAAPKSPNHPGDACNDGCVMWFSRAVTFCPRGRSLRAGLFSSANLARPKQKRMSHRHPRARFGRTNNWT